MVPEGWQVPADGALELSRDKEQRQVISINLEAKDYNHRQEVGGQDQQDLYLAPVGVRPNGTWEVLHTNPDYIWYDRQVGYQAVLRTHLEPYATRTRYDVAPNLVALDREAMEEVAPLSPPAVWDGPGYVHKEKVVLQQAPIDSAWTDEVLNVELRKVYPMLDPVTIEIPTIDPCNTQEVNRIAKKWVDEIFNVEVAKGVAKVPIDAKHLLRASQNFRNFGRAQVGQCTLRAKQGDARFKHKMPPNVHVVISLRPSTPPPAGFRPLLENARGVEGKAASTKATSRTSFGPRPATPKTYAEASVLPSTSSLAGPPRSLLGMLPTDRPQSTPAGSPDANWPPGPSSLTGGRSLAKPAPTPLLGGPAQQARGMMGPPVCPQSQQGLAPPSPHQPVSARAPRPPPQGAVPRGPASRLPGTVRDPTPKLSIGQLSLPPAVAPPLRSVQSLAQKSQTMAQALRQASTTPQFTYISGKQAAALPSFKRISATKTTPSVEGTPPKQGRRVSGPTDSSPVFTAQRPRQSVPPVATTQSQLVARPLFTAEELAPPAKKKSKRANKKQRAAKAAQAQVQQTQTLPPSQAAAQGGRQTVGAMNVTISKPKGKGEMVREVSLVLAGQPGQKGLPKETPKEAPKAQGIDLDVSPGLFALRREKRRTEVPVPLSSVIAEIRADRNQDYPPCGGPGVRTPQIWPTEWPQANLEKHRLLGHKLAELFLWLWRIQDCQRNKTAIFIPAHQKRTYLFFKYHHAWFQAYREYFFPRGYALTTWEMGMPSPQGLG